MTNHPIRGKISIDDLSKGQLISAKDCARRIRIGGFDVYGRSSPWQPKWCLDDDNIIKVGLAYNDSLIVDKPAGAYSRSFHLIVESDIDGIRNRRDGSPEEKSSRARREKRDLHECILWRLQQAQEAVDKELASNNEDSDLEEIARAGFF